jgi:hypothetical protein
MELSDLKLDSTRQYTVLSTGKKYPIKQQRGRYYIQHATGQLTVTSLMKEVIPNDRSIADYVFNGWFEQYDYETYKSFADHELSQLK